MRCAARLALAVEREDLDKALDLQAKLIEAGERTPELFYNTGLLLQKSGQTEDAIICLYFRKRWRNGLRLPKRCSIWVMR